MLGHAVGERWLRAVSCVRCRLPPRATQAESKQACVAPPACPSNSVRRHAARPGATARPRPLGRTCRQLLERAQYKFATARDRKLRLCVEAFAFRRLLKRRAGDTIGMWLQAARPRNWRDRVASMAAWRPANGAVQSLIPRCGGRQRGVRRHRRCWLPLVHQLRGKHGPRPLPTLPPRVPRTPAVGHAVRWSPKASSTPPHRHRRGPSGTGSRNRLSIL